LQLRVPPTGAGVRLPLHAALGGALVCRPELRAGASRVSAQSRGGAHHVQHAAASADLRGRAGSGAFPGMVMSGFPSFVALARVCLLGALLLLVTGCKRPYRIGEYVWVEWEEGAYYPAYIIQKKGPTRYRVHFEGYESRWDEDVTLDRIRGRIDGPVTPPPPPKKVQ